MARIQRLHLKRKVSWLDLTLWQHKTRKIPEDTCPPVAWRAEKGHVRSFENLAFLCCFLGGLLGVSSFRKATPEAGGAASRQQWWGHTRYRDVNIAPHQSLEGINRWVLCIIWRSAQTVETQSDCYFG